MATAAVLLPTTPSTYCPLPFELPEQRFVGILACQRDPLLQSLEARVTRCDRVKPAAVKGSKNKSAALEEWEVELDDTIVFPTGGGQPSDVGTISPLADPDKTVRVREAVRVGLAATHLTDGPLEVGERVRVEIDFSRRLDLMTQHLGQHLLSAVLEKECGLDTVSWALSPHPEPSFVELLRAPTADEVAQVESLCNAHIRSNLPVRIDVSLPSEDNPRPPKLPRDYVGGVHRVVHIGELDSNACCGSHPPSLSLLQGIKVFPQTTSVRGTNARLYFLVGERITSYLARAEEQIRAACGPLSCSAEELPARVALVADDRKMLAKREQRLRTRLAAIDAASILASGDSVVLKEELDDDAEYLGMLAWALLELGLSKAVALACQPLPGTQEGAALVVCGGTNIDGIGVALRKAFGSRLKGGGKGRFQGKLSGRWAEQDLQSLRDILSQT